MRTQLSRIRCAAMVAVALALPALVGAQGNLRTAISATQYFPLRVGNTWTFQRSGPGNPTEWTAEVTDRQSPLRALPYFVLEGYFPGAPHAVRADPFGTVMAQSGGFRDYLWYLLGAPEGTSWTIQLPPSALANPLPDCVAGAKLRLAARDETVSVPAGVFTRVVRVDYSSPCVDAGITSEWFAPAVGLIRRQETSIAGPVVSELIRADLGAIALPRAGYVTSMSLDRAAYVNNLMPPVGAGALPTVTGTFTVTNRPEAGISLVFGGCKSISIAVLNEAGETVLKAGGDDGGCCTCRTLITWDFTRGPLLIPFHFTLATEKGEALPDGAYAVLATLDTGTPEPLRPSVRARIEVTSTH